MQKKFNGELHPNKYISKKKSTAELLPKIIKKVRVDYILYWIRDEKYIIFLQVEINYNIWKSCNSLQIT